ncbi:MAG: hypothetical protein KA362_00140 [Chloroflexi bacterium]|nr:hypothetical protein [Chloroflexota bacterium]
MNLSDEQKAAVAARIERLRAEIEKYVADANNTVSHMNGRIAELESLLQPEAEPVENEAE